MQSLLCPGGPALGNLGPGGSSLATSFPPHALQSSLTPILTPWEGLAPVALFTQTSAPCQAAPAPARGPPPPEDLFLPAAFVLNGGDGLPQ